MFYRQNLLKLLCTRISFVSGSNASKHVYRCFTTSTAIPPEFVKTLTLRTCAGDVYDYLRTLHPDIYKNSPSEGVDITFEYLDTGKPSNTSETKNILALHGSADTYHTFIKTIEHFMNRSDVRVIAPNLPDFTQTRQTNFKFWHSNLERYHFIKDFLLYLNVKTVDCAMVHSYGVQPALSLIKKQEGIKVKSIALCAPQFFLDPFFDERQIKITKTLFMFKSKLGTKFLNALKLYQSKMIPFRFNNMDQLYSLLCLVYDEPMYRDAPKNVTMLKNSGVPGFLLFASNERILRPKNIEQAYELLGIRDEDKTHIDRDDPSLVPQLPSNKIQSFVVKDAAHFPHAKYPNFTNALIEQLLKKT